MSRRLLHVVGSYGILMVTMLGENDPASFGNLHIAVLSLYRMATGDDWTDILCVYGVACSGVH